MRFCFVFTVIYMSLVSSTVSAQVLKGYVLDANNEPIPYAHIFIQEIQNGVVTDDKGFYYIRLDLGGAYKIKVSCLGYQKRTIPIVVQDGAEVQKNILLQTSSVELENIVVRASRKDPAYEIIRNAIRHKKKYLKSINSYKTEVYVKATEIIKTRKKAKKHPQTTALDSLQNAHERQREANAKFMQSINLLEMKVTLNYQYPRKYKEIRTAYKKYGTDAGLFVPHFAETDFNFYRNMVRLKGISEMPLISPLSITSILSYKFKLIESKKEHGFLVHKIKVIPRKKGNSTCSGYIYINDGLWNINRLALNLYKGSLKFYDAFTLHQSYQMLADSTWIPNRQVFDYQTKQGRKKIFTGKTTLHYTNFQKDHEFSDSFFTNEIVRTEADAYKKDSVYWNNSRPEPLTTNEQKIIVLRDSLYTLENSTAYKDSVQKAYNRVRLVELFWDGVGFRNYLKRSRIFLGSIPSLVDFEMVGGWRVGPYIDYVKGWDNARQVTSNARVTYGFQNRDYNGYLTQKIYYDPHHIGSFSWQVSRRFEAINPFDAYLNQMNSANYTLNESLKLTHRIEIFNGFYFDSKVQYANRKSIKNLKSNTIFDQVIISDKQPIDFQPYKALVTDLTLSYTPNQRFITEPNEKIVLGSRYPIFTLRHKKGWNGTLGSDINFDYVELGIKQDLILGSFGSSKYGFVLGDFLNTRNLKPLDVKRFRQSDPFLYSAPLRSFQSLDTTLHTTNLFIEFHHIHHFNGAFINNIPLIKKTRVRLVAGGGFMWINDNHFRHEEIFLGLERVFKLGARRRLRLGAYGVLSNGNRTKLKESFKISIDLIDVWKKEWSY